MSQRHNYKNLGGDSGVEQFEIGDDWIRVIFDSGAEYLYTAYSAGSENITEMKRLAHEGEGLNSFIMLNVAKDYESKKI